MPKICIKTLPLPDPVHVPEVIVRLGSVLESSLGFLPQQFVILWEYIPAGHFLFNGEIANIQPADTHHPIVEITVVEGMSRDREQRMIKTLAAALSRELKVSETNICVHINTLQSEKLYVFGKFKKTKHVKCRS